LLQPWYNALEAMHYLLPEDQAREKLAGQSWQVGAQIGSAGHVHDPTKRAGV
jgi:hypothetical protein